MRLVFVDNAPDVVDALRRAFASHPEVEIREGDILDCARHAIVSPSNSYGYMDGGIDRLYVEMIGSHLQGRVLQEIERQADGRVPVGQAILVGTGDKNIPYLIVAPTMETPQVVDPANAYFAMAAILRLIDRSPQLDEVYCPGLGTGVGHADPKEVAKEMAGAYGKWKARQQQL